MDCYTVKTLLGPWKPGDKITADQLKAQTSLGGADRLIGLGAIEVTFPELPDEPPEVEVIGSIIGKVSENPRPNARGQRRAGKS